MKRPASFLIRKISPVALGEVVYRERLFADLNTNGQTRVYWISGPGGSGKTTLITSFLQSMALPVLWYNVDSLDQDPASFFYYFSQAVAPIAQVSGSPLPQLTSEYLLHLDTFALRYFESAYLQLPGNLWIVLDNVQDAPDKKTFFQLLSIAIKQLPKNMKIAIVSRYDPPSSMVRLLANRTMKQITQHHLDFTLRELQQLVKLLEFNLSHHDVKVLHQLSQGWVAGAILWLLRDPVSKRDFSTCSIPNTVMNYFVSEVLEQTEEPERSFLLDTSFLPYMTEEMACEISQLDAGPILRSLCKRNTFIRKKISNSGVFQYHLLFRKCLQHVARQKLSSEVMRTRQYCAARILERHGDLENAVKAYSTIQAYDEIQSVIHAHAQDMLIQEKYEVLRSWVDQLPEAIIIRQPWLCHFKGVATMLTNPEEGTHLAGEAYTLFTSTGDLPGRVHSWSMIIEMSFMMRGDFAKLDHWINEGSKLGRELADVDDVDLSARFSCAMLMALLLRHQAHPEMNQWQGHCEHLLGKCDSQYVRATLMANLFWAYSWLGHVNKALQMEAKLRMELRAVSSPLIRIILLTTLTLSYAHRASHRRCGELAKETLAMAEQYGIHVYDFVLLIYSCYPGLCTGNANPVRPFLKRMKRILKPNAIWDHGLYYFFSAWHNILIGELNKANKDLVIAEDLLESCGNPYVISLTRILHSQYCLEIREPIRAIELLNANLQDARIANSGSIHLICHLALADCSFEMNDVRAMQHHLSIAFTQAREYGMPMPNALINRRLGSLCLKALESGIERYLVEAFITSWDLKPSTEARSGTHWPYPLRIFCLGRFEIEIQGTILQTTGKPQLKPLALLKLLMASGGRKASVAAIANTLWPDADGDMQHQIFNTTLHRLRKLLKSAQTLKLEAGELMINSDLCWTDVWAFEQSANEIQLRIGTQRNELGWLKEVEEIFAQYQGHFLPNEQESWAIPIREKLQNRMVTTMELVGTHYEKHHMWQEAITLYQKSLSVVPTTETLYRRLMLCLQKLGKNDEAMHCYRQCKEVLQASFGVQVSRAMHDLYQELKNSN